MAPPVIATKLYVPKLRPGWVTRARLRERLRQGAQSRLVLVSAPAGFGKTTLLAQWLAQPAGGDPAVAWVSLGPEDSDPVSFWTCVVTALHSALPGVRSSALDLIASPLPVERLLVMLVNELAALPGPVWLVLDDYHLAGSQEVDEGLAFFLDHLPPQAHVVLSTRSDPGLPLSRWRVGGELTEIRAAELRFTVDEAVAYLGQVTGLSLHPDDVAALEQRTEGWIAAIQLAALSLQGRDDARGFIARFAGDDRYIVDYLVEEVLRHQPQPVRDFLLRSAILDRFTGPLCDAVTASDGGSDRLIALERANLFLVPLDDRRQWYRYHQLFADVLRARMLAEQPDQVPLLHQRASRWFERHDLPEEAIRHALAARDFDRAAYLVELVVPAIRRDRREAVLLGWLTSLPDQVIRGSPVLSVFRGYMLMVAGDLDAVEPRLDDAERALAAVPAGSAPPWALTDDLRTLPATIAIFRASIAQARGDVPGTAHHARRALALAGPADHLARGGAAGFLGLAAWADGDVPGALTTFAQAVESLHAAGNVVDALNSTVVLADIWRAAGQPGTARTLIQRGIELAHAHGLSAASAAVDLHVGMSEIDGAAGDLESAIQHLDQAQALAQQASRAESRYRWFVARSLVAQAQGDLQRAIALLDTAERLYLPGFFPEVRPIPAMRARLWIELGDLSQAAAWADERGVSVTDDVTYLREFDHLTLVRLRIAQHRDLPGSGALDGVHDLLDRLLGAAVSAGHPGSVPEIRELQTLVAQAQAQAHGHGQGQGQARGRASSASLSERELDVLRMLDSELTGPQIARELFVSHNTLRTHTKHIFTKLGVSSRRAAVQRARERGLM